MRVAINIDRELTRSIVDEILFMNTLETTPILTPGFQVHSPGKLSVYDEVALVPHAGTFANLAPIV